VKRNNVLRSIEKTIDCYSDERKRALALDKLVRSIIDMYLELSSTDGSPMMIDQLTMIISDLDGRDPGIKRLEDLNDEIGIMVEEMESDFDSSEDN